MDNFKITKTILENINEQNDRINECVDIVNGYTTDEETRVNQELQRQENELRREEQYNNIENRFNEINVQLDNIDREKVNEVFVAKKIAEAKLEGAGVDTSSLVFRNDIDEELMKAEKRLDIKYVRGTIYGNGSFGDDNKYFRSKDALTFSKDTISKIYVTEGFQVSIWRWSDLSQNALAVQTFTSNTDFTFKANLYYHFVLKRINTSETMLEEEKSNIKIITYPNYYFKVGLNEVNNKINDLDTNINELIDTLKTGKKEVEVSFVRGTIAGPGVFYDSTNHFRSSSYLKYNENKVLTFYVPNGYVLSLWCYNTDYSNGVNSISITNITSKMNSELKANKYYYLTIKKDGDNNYLVEDSIVSNVKIYEDIDFDYKKTQKEILNRLDNLGASYATKYSDKEDSIVNNVYKFLNSGTIVFGLTTDNHCGITNWDSVFNHHDILNSLAERIGADFCINLGDIFTETDDRVLNLEKLRKCWKVTDKYFLPNMYCKGNHECFIRSDGKPALQDWEILGQTQRSNRYIERFPKTETYYYFDVRQCRFIVLDSSSNGNNGFSDGQIPFLEESLSTLGDKKALIFSHLPPSGSVTIAGEPKNGSEIRNVMNKYKDKIIAVMFGHVHWDNYCKVDDIMYIATCCSMPGKVSESELAKYTGEGTPTVYDRVHGSYTEYCMDIVCVDVYSNIIRTFRFGAGSNRNITCK